MKTKPRSCWARLCLLQASCFQFPRVVILALFAAFLLPAQIAVAAEALDKEAQYQKALANGREAQKEDYYVTALMFYDEALKLKPGDEVAAKLKSDMQAKLPPPTFSAKPADITPAPPSGQPPEAAPSQTASTPVTQVEQPVPPPAEMLSTTAPPSLKPPKVTKHEISAAADFMLGEGNVTLPLLYSLSKVDAFPPNTFQPTTADAERNSQYLGGTISYSYGQAWYLDLGYVRGTSSGTVPIDFPNGPDLDSKFTIDDNWYQAYVRYTFPSLRGKRLSAYMRAGVSYVQAELTDETQVPALGLYRQEDDTTDLLGNLGFGAGYRLYAGKRFRLGLQAEVEGFYGARSQESLETLDESVYELPLSEYETANIDNTLYGGIGRATVRVEYRLGRSGLMKVFADVGLQGRFTQISYPEGAGNFSELLWGPYGKVGLSYAF